MVNIHNNISNDLEDQEPIDPETNEVVRDAQDEIVAEIEQLVPDILILMSMKPTFSTNHLVAIKAD